MSHVNDRSEVGISRPGENDLHTDDGGGEDNFAQQVADQQGNTTSGQGNIHALLCWPTTSLTIFIEHYVTYDGTFGGLRSIDGDTLDFYDNFDFTRFGDTGFTALNDNGGTGGVAFSIRHAVNEDRFPPSTSFTNLTILETPDDDYWTSPLFAEDFEVHDKWRHSLSPTIEAALDPIGAVPKGPDQSASLQTQVSNILDLFTEALRVRLSQRPAEKDVQRPGSVALEDALQRYRIWAGSQGALRNVSDTRSLGHKLKCKPNIAQTFVELLNELDALLSVRECRLRRTVSAELSG